jgi:hypothetical protein
MEYGNVGQYARHGFSPFLPLPIGKPEAIFGTVFKKIENIFSARKGGLGLG